MTLKHFSRYQLPFLIYAVAIFAVSSISKLPTVDIGFSFLDKTAHFFEFFIFALLAIRALSQLPFANNGLRVYIAAIVFSVVFAASDEYHQSFVPGREADPADFMADSAGVILGCTLHFLLHKMRRHAS